MSDQHVGVKAQFLTPGFSRGLARYLSGLAQAIAATNNTVAAINNLGAQSSAVFSALGSNARATANALKAVATAAQAANRALNTGQRRRGGATTTRTQQAGGLTAALGAATARAQGQATTQINAAAAATRNLGQQARTTAVSISGLNAKTIALGTALGSIAASAIRGLGGAIVGFGREVLEIVTFFERLDLSIAFFTARSFQAEDATLSFNDALAMGEKEAQGLAIWLQRLAVASPFTTRTVGILFRTAQAYGLTRKEAEQMTPLLLDFGAAAGLDADILERLALALGQVRSRGKLTGEEVRQLGNSGLPVRDILVKALGIANSEFDELLESGALTSDVVIPHLIEALRAFEGAGERVAFGTIGGIISAMEELREISTAKFFVGFLEPLKKSFQDLFKVLNRPDVLAFITILGQELGVKFRDAVLGTVAAIKSYIVAFTQLDPAVKQQIVVFVAATAGVFALAAAFGLLTLAMGVLANPLVLIATTIGFLISEWTSGFAVLRGITSRVTRTVANALGGMVRAIGATVVGFASFISDITLGFNNLEGAAVNFGFNIGASLAEGINASGSVLASALGGIGRLLAFFLAPGSPPRIAPDIDVWGEKTMLEWGKGVGRADATPFIGPVGKDVIEALRDFGPDFRDQGGKSMLEYGKGIVDADFIGPLEQGSRRAVQTLGSDDVMGEAAEAGIRVSDSFVEGFLSRIPTLTPRISEELQEVLSKIGGGAQLTRAGAMSFGRFLQGFGEADFGVLDNVTDIVQNFLQSLVDTGEIEDVDLPRLLFGARQDLAQGIQDIERVGHVTESTMQRIRLTAGGASTFVLDLLNAYAPLAEATDRVEEAQTALNDVTEKYKAIITPLRKELEAINEANRMADDEEKILSLRRLIANEAVSDRRRRNAQLEIDQIIAEQRVRGLETERDAAVETAETELEAREKTQEKLDDQFQTLQATIQAQLSQLDLFSQEASIIKRLREEAEKLREKELSQTDLQLKFLELQNEEVQDLIAAARAKHTLEDATSTILEKETAQITLAEIALRRRNREAEAIKLGIPVEELTKLRAFEVTLDDLGIKVKDVFTAPDTGAFGESLVDANAITAEWELTLAKVRDRWNEIKTNIKETAAEINANLPSFLKIFPEVEGGEPPIIGFIKGYGAAIVGLAVAMTTYKIVMRLADLTRAVRGLLIIGGATAAGGGAAAGGGGGAAAAGGGLTVFGSLIAGIGLLAAEALVAYGALILLGKALEAIGFDMRPGDVINAEAVADTLGEFGPAAQSTIDNLASNLTINDHAASALADNITSAATSAIQDGFGNEHVIASIGNAINQSIVEGLIADTPENRVAIAAFQARLGQIISENAPGTTPKINILTGKELEATPSPEAAAKVKADVQSFLAGITDDEETKGVFAESMKSLITDATNLGMQRAGIDRLVFSAFNEGVSAGLVADTPANRTAISDYIDGIVAQLKTKSEIDSPSQLAKREIGLPIGMGIVSGINAALVLQRASVITELGEVFGGMKTLMALRMAEIRFDQQTNWKAIRTTGETESSALKTEVLLTFGSLLTTLTARMLAIKTVVVNGFTTMRTESEAQALLLKTNIIRLFAGEKGSILDAIEIVFLGKDDIVPRNIGRDFIEGIGLGMMENKDNLATAMTKAMSFALGETQTNLALAAVNAPLEARYGSRVGPPSAATNVSNSRVSHYHLNVNSSMKSQGIVDDFGILKTLEG